MAATQHVSGYLLEVSLSRLFVPYRIGYDEKGAPIIKNDVIFSIELNEYANSYVIQDLEPDTPYFIKLTAYNRAGSTSQIIGPIWTQKPAYQTVSSEAWYDVLKEVVQLDWRGSGLPDFTHITYSSVNAIGDVNSITVNNVTHYELPLTEGEYLIRIQPCVFMGCGVIHEHIVKVPFVRKRVVGDPVIFVDEARIKTTASSKPITEVLRLLDSPEITFINAIYAAIDDWTGMADKVEYVLNDFHEVLDVSVFADSEIVEVIDPKEVVTVSPKDVWAFFDTADLILSQTVTKNDVVPIYDDAGGQLTTYIYLPEADRFKITETTRIPDYKEFAAVTRTKFIDPAKQHEVRMILHSEYKFPDDSVRELVPNYVDNRDYIEFNTEFNTVQLTEPAVPDTDKDL